MKLKEIQALYLSLYFLDEQHHNFKLTISDGTFTFSGELLPLSDGSMSLKLATLNNWFDMDCSYVDLKHMNLFPIRILKLVIDNYSQIGRISANKAFAYPDLLLSKLINLIKENPNPELDNIESYMATDIEFLSGKKVDNFLLDKDADYRVISLEVVEN